MADGNEILKVIDDYDVEWLKSQKSFAEIMQRLLKAIQDHTCFMSIANGAKNDDLCKAEYRTVLELIEITQLIITEKINSCNEQLKN